MYKRFYEQKYKIEYAKHKIKMYKSFIEQKYKIEYTKHQNKSLSMTTNDLFYIILLQLILLRLFISFL